MSNSRFVPQLIFGVSALLVGASTALAKTSDWRAQWRVSLGAEDYRNLETARRGVTTQLDLGLRYRLDEDVLLKLSPSARLQAGASQNIEGSTAPPNQIVFTEASVTWRPFSMFLIKGGALNQADTHSPLLVGERPFPAARLHFQTGGAQMKIALVGESAVPTSMSLTPHEGEREQLPSLNSVQLRWEWTDKALAGVEVRVGGFQFNNLATGTANESALRGNTADVVADAEYAFRYPYRGVESQISGQLPIGKNMDLKAFASSLQNTAAPAGKNTAWMSEASARIGINPKFDVIGAGRYFRVESDAAVASFNEDLFSGTNRVGYSVDAGVAFGRKKTRVIGRVGESDLINVNDPQSRERFVVFKLESNYADF